jgi:hypothetical protein
MTREESQVQKKMKGTTYDSYGKATYEDVYGNTTQHWLFLLGLPRKRKIHFDLNGPWKRIPAKGWTLARCSSSRLRTPRCLCSPLPPYWSKWRKLQNLLNYYWISNPCVFFSCTSLIKLIQNFKNFSFSKFFEKIGFFLSVQVLKNKLPTLKFEFSKFFSIFSLLLGNP